MNPEVTIDTRRKGEPDLALFILVFLLAGIGLAMSYSASAVHAMDTFGDSFYFLKRQLAWFLTGFMVMLVLQEIDYRHYPKFTKVMLFLSIIGLILVLIPGIGQSVKGSARWLDLGLFSIQPSEPVKLFIVIFLAKIFSTEDETPQLARFIVPVVIVGLIFVLVMLQPDFGTAISILFISVLLLFLSGFPALYLTTLAMISLPMFYLIIYQVNYRKERIMAFLDPWQDRYGSGYHIIQSFTAFKMGGLMGVGLGFGSQKISRLPEPHTDFVFAVIAEEAGFIGTAFIVILFALVFWRGVTIAINAPDSFSRLLAVGLALFITVQAYINIGVVTGALPTTGIPLPFVSYGGSSLICNMAAVGILLNISRYREAAFNEININEEGWVQ